MAKKICILASSNQDKLREMKAILAPHPLEIHSAAELGPELDVEENADSFAGNAHLKTKAYHALYPDAYILADDSGLCIDALNGRPGVYSARFGGTRTDYPKKFKLLGEMLQATAVPAEQWTAHFACAVSWFAPEAKAPLSFEGRFDGRIILEPRGRHGFGYDPIFWLDAYGQTAAELDPALKNRLSHRAKALQKLIAYLEAHGL